MSALVNLRPMSVGDILDHAISLYRQNFVTFAGIAAIVSVPFALLQIIPTLLALGFTSANPSFNSPAPDPARLLAAFTALCGIGVVFLLFFILAAAFEYAALTFAVSERYIGRAINVRQAYGRALRRWQSLLVATILVGVINLVVSLFSFIPAFCIPCVGVLLVPVLLLLVNTPLVFTLQAIVLENLQAVASISRSWSLVRGSFWRVFLALLVLVLFYIALTLGPTSAIQVSMLFVFPSAPLVATAFNAVAGAIISTLITPLVFAILTLLYYDLRIRKEGFDLEMLAQQLDQTPALPQLSSL